MNLLHKKFARQRHGFSLLEVLVGLTITLVVLLAMTQAFRFASQEMALGRASVELTNRLRTAEALLRRDLDRLTVSPRPHFDAAAAPKGYFELVDGSATDTNNFRDSLATPPTAAATINNLRDASIRSLAMGDYDDLWSGTIRTNSQPFRGRNGTNVEQSHLAEVVWYTARNDLNDDTFIEVSERVNLFRRVLLIKPGLTLLLPNGTAIPTFPNLLAANAARSLYLQSNDVSVSVRETTPGSGTFEVFANSLETLTLRSNRFFTATHGLIAGGSQAAQRLNYRNGLRYLKASDFPTAAAFTTAQALRLRSLDNQNLLLNDVLAFDIQVFDPTATVAFSTDGTIPRAVVSPADAGRTEFDGLTNFDGEGTNFVQAAIGTYVDLGKTLGSGQFAGIGVNTQRFIDQVYDTGTPLYESNNIDDDADGLIDEGGDSIDNDGDGLIDENDEKEFGPNFDAPIRGLRVRIRLLEPVSGQVSQTTVNHSFQ